MGAMKRTAVRERIIIVGEEPLVGEFRRSAEARGFHVDTRPSRSQDRARRARTAACAFELTNTDQDRKQKNLRSLDRALGGDAIIFSSSVVFTAEMQSGWIRRPERLVGISALPTLLTGRLLELAPSLRTSTTALKHATAICARLGKEPSVVQDRIGMVLPRILCTLVNEAAFAVMDSVASPADIDRAMELGASYPLGPIEWGDRIGIGQVLSVLDALRQDTGEERYRPAPLLRQLAAGAQWWKT